MVFFTRVWIIPAMGQMIQVMCQSKLKKLQIRYRQVTVGQ